jgi:hypothetical protein
MKKLSLYFLLILTGLGFAQFENVKLPLPKNAKYAYSQVEPSICVNPKNTNEVIAGTVMNDYYYSIDGGKIWKSKSIKSKYGVNGDPCMLIDTLGRYFYFHLSNVKGQSLIGGMVSQYTKKIKGSSWKSGHTVANGKYHDKQWVCLNPKTNHIYMTWTQFDAYDSGKSKDKSNILFSKTEDGHTWSEVVDISYYSGDCLDNDKTAEGAVPAIGPNGEIYVVWARDDSLWFNMSLDDGKTWFEREKFIIEQPKGWVIDIPGIFRCNGLPVTMCDLSNSENNGTIYINWADQLNGEDNTDIWLISSKDGGKTWSKRIKVNDDNSGKHQFLTWMTIDQSNGFLYFVFYDRRAHEDRKTDVYLAVSKDGGQTIQNYKISKEPFKPNPKIFFGDYTNISVHNGVIRPIWTRLHAGRISAWTALIEQGDLDK